MSKVIVLSCGRTGTNMVLEILAGSSFLKESRIPENKYIFKYPNKRYEYGYLTKSDTTYTSFDSIKNFMDINKDFNIIWTIRNPRDVCMSKIRRGQPFKNGGNSKILATDATIDGSVTSVTKMFNIYQKLINSNIGYRIFLVHMESILDSPKITVSSMCNFLDIPFENKMLKFYERMRDPFKKKRYNKIDKNQIGLWKRWYNVYGGFFVKNGYNLERDLFPKLNDICKYFGYEEFQ